MPRERKGKRDTHKDYEKAKIRREEEETLPLIKINDPFFNPNGDQWEFYKVGPDDHILDIIVDATEEGIKEKHQQLLLEHTTALAYQEKRKKTIANRGVKKEINTQDHADLKLEILTLKMNGVGLNDIILQVKQKYTHVQAITIGDIINNVLDDIKKKAKHIAEQTVLDHQERYEALYFWFKENNYPRLAMKALQMRENLMGVESNGKREEFLEKLQGVEYQALYDFNKLTSKELDRMNRLIGKTITSIRPSANS